MGTTTNNTIKRVGVILARVYLYYKLYWKKVYLDTNIGAAPGIRFKLTKACGRYVGAAINYTCSF